MPKPYLVTVEIEYAVMAEDKEDAMSVAADAVRDECFIEDSCSEVRPLNFWPIGWEDSPEALLYWGKKAKKSSEFRDITIKEALEMSPEYKKQMEKAKTIADAVNEVFGKDKKE